MGNQIIISISREYGSEGHTIAKQIAKDLGLPFYDRNMLDEIAKEKGFDPAVFAGVDEKPRNKLLSRRVKGIRMQPKTIWRRCSSNFFVKRPPPANLLSCLAVVPKRF